MTEEEYKTYIDNQFFIIDCLKKQIIEKDTQIAKLMNKVKQMQNSIKCFQIMFIEED